MAEFSCSVDIKALLTCRFREQLLNQFFASNLDQASDARLPLTDFMITLHSYAFVGVLLKWLREGMSYPPEVMGEFLHHFIGIERKRAAVERFKDVIR